MQHWLAQFDPRDLALASFALGMWYANRAHRGSLREHGQRLGAIAGRLTRVESAHGIAPPQPPGGSDGG